MPIYENILKKLNSKDITLDRSQLDFIDIFNKHKPKKSRLFFTLSKNIIKGFYLWGEVGRGKTLLLNSIYDELKLKKAKFHYIDFMQLIHKDLKALSGKKNPLDIIADSIVSDFEVIFIDEFQVEDVADAMLITNLFKKLFEKDIYFLLSSNAHPTNLYLDGLQRQKFVSAINLMEKHLNIYKLDGDRDYRISLISQFEKNNDSGLFNKKKIKDFISSTFNCDEFINQIEINNRYFSCNGFNNSFLWISFSKFFREPSSAKDYIEICKKFDWILINEFGECGDDEADRVRRFISFIDVTYKENAKVKFFHEGVDPKNLYIGKKFQYLWERSQSRISEMKSKKYLLNSGKN
jgi:cell division protein ZapE